MAPNFISAEHGMMVHPITQQYYLSVCDVQEAGQRIRNSWSMLQFTSGSDAFIYDFQDEENPVEIARIESLDQFTMPERYLNIGCKQCYVHYDDETEIKTTKFFDQNEYNSLVFQRIQTAD